MVLYRVLQIGSLNTPLSFSYDLPGFTQKAGRGIFSLKALNINGKHAMYGPSGRNFAIQFYHLKTNTLSTIL